MATKKTQTLKFDKVFREIESILPNSPIKTDLIHAKLVLRWVLKIKPDADEALKIAALSHDIDRAVTGITEKDLRGDFKPEDYAAFKKAHSIRSADFICEILERYEYPKEIIQKVRHLVENHEFGGDEETDILTDADSMAYFEYNIPNFLERNGESNTKKKIFFMYGRMSPRAKRLIRGIKYKDPKISALVEQSILR